jgi:translocation and assembly module TamB
MKTVDGPQPHLDRPMAWVMCGQALGGQVHADLAIGRTQVYPLRGLVSFDRLSFGELLPRARARTPMFGHVSGSLLLRGGALLEPHTLAGEALFSDLAAGQADVELRNDGPIDLRFGDGAFEVRRARLTGPSSKLEIAGGGSISDGLGLSVDGDVDVGLLTSLSQTVTEAQGKIGLRFKITGLLAAPSVYGEALLRGASLKIASFPEAIRDVGGKITFTARRALLEGFSAKVAGGTVSWGGVAELEGRSIGNYSLQIEARELSLRPRDGIDLQVSGHGDLSWKQGQRLPLLSGRLRLDQLVYARPIKMDRTLGEMYGPERAEVAEYDPENDLLAIDLMLQQARPLYVRNNLIEAELRLENDKQPFRLVGTDQRFGVVGNMSVRKGTVRFRDHAFDIRQGDIHFDDETRIDPNFDLRANTEVRRESSQQDWRIEIHAFGNRDQFRFELSSEPTLAEDDIALLLTVGMTQSELAQLQASDVGGAAALEALATVTGVESEVHRALPQIDDFQIASTYSERSNRTEPQLSIGKRIAENVRLRASTGIAESRDFSTGVELQLDDKTKVQAVYNNQNTSTASQVGDVGVDLKWRLEFD